MCVCVTTGTSAVWKLIMAIAIGAVLVLGLVCVHNSACFDTPCPDGRLCPSNWTCCEQGCCAPTTPHSRSDIFRDHGFMDHPWYTQWPVLFFLGILGGILICCMWFCICKRYAPPDGVLAISCACCLTPGRSVDELDSAGSLYPPPHYSRCGSIHQAPPPYSEVQSKPDLYPLVITCADGEGKAGGNYVMVQYFQNYVIRPPPVSSPPAPQRTTETEEPGASGGARRPSWVAVGGSLSATSTAESLNSSFICNATNEANTIIPPPYSCSNNFEEFGVGRSMLRSMSSLMEPSGAAPELPPRTRLRDFTLHTPMRQRNTTNLTENMLEDSMFNDSVERVDLALFARPDKYRPHGRKAKAQASYCHQTPETATFEGYSMRQPLESPVEPQQTSPSPPGNEPVRKQSDERRQRRVSESLRRNSGKSSMFMPLSTAAYSARPSRISPGSRAFSSSAPATPCSNLVPNLLNLTQRVSASRHSSRSSRLEEEYDPLLTEIEQLRTDDKF